MATTVGNFSAIDDTEVDAESPVTETLVTRLRDNSYWIDAGTRRTTQTSTTKVLTPDGSNGVVWTEVSTIAGVDGTKGNINTTALLNSSWTTLTTKTSGILIMSTRSNSTGSHVNGSVTIDLSGDTFVFDWLSYTVSGGAYASGSGSGTITTGSATVRLYVFSGTSAGTLDFRRDSGNLQYQGSLASQQALYASWVIL